MCAACDVRMADRYGDIAAEFMVLSGAFANMDVKQARMAPTVA